MKYEIRPYRNKVGKIVAWAVITPDQWYLKFVATFNDAVVWMDSHAGTRPGK